MAEDILPAGGLSREEAAKREMDRTAVGTTTAWVLVGFFLASIAIVSVVELLAGSDADGAGGTVWATLARTPANVAGAVRTATASNASMWQRLLAGNRALLAGLTGFETALEDESVLGRALRPDAQQLLSGRLGAGNERVYVGRDGWLFFRPDVEYLTGRGFLEEDVLRRRIAKASELTTLPQPDPRPAILEFHRQLAARGVTLVLVPAPVKPGVHPEKLASGVGSGTAVQNPSYDDWRAWLQANGILVFDPAPILTAARQSGSQYLATDTHWRPEGMELVAERLAAFVQQHVRFGAAPERRFTIEEREITNAGDTVVMLDLPASQRRYAAEKVVISRVLEPDGGAWRSDRNADVLVLGDSFSNIYSLSSMG
jgi:alginate O-acetyltransferase complex protein AlgJ